MREIDLIFSNDGLNFTDNAGVCAVNRLIGGIFRQQPDLAALFLKALDRGGIVQQRDDDLAVLRRALRPDNDLVAA